MKKFVLLLLLIPQLVLAQTLKIGEKDLVGDGIVLKHVYSVSMDKPDSLWEDEKSIWIKGQKEFPIRLYNEVDRNGSTFKNLSMQQYVFENAGIGDTVDYNINVSPDTTYIYNHSVKISDSTFVRYQMNNQRDTFIMINGEAKRVYVNQPIKQNRDEKILRMLDRDDYHYYDCDYSRSNDKRDKLGRIDTTHTYLRGCSRRPICSNDRCPYYFYHARDMVYSYEGDSYKPFKAQTFNTNKPSCTPGFSDTYIGMIDVKVVEKKSFFRRFVDWISSPFMSNEEETAEQLSVVTPKIKQKEVSYTLVSDTYYKYDAEGRLIEISVYDWQRKTITTTKYTYCSASDKLSFGVLLNLF